MEYAASLLVIVLICCTFTSLPAHADDSPKADVAVSYALLREPNVYVEHRYRSGWVASAGWYPTHFFGIVGEVGANYYTHELFPGQPPPPLKDSEYNFMIGPKVVLRR